LLLVTRKKEGGELACCNQVRPLLVEVKMPTDVEIAMKLPVPSMVTDVNRGGAEPAGIKLAGKILLDCNAVHAAPAFVEIIRPLTAFCEKMPTMTWPLFEVDNAVQDLSRPACVRVTVGGLVVLME